jgi:hypothetical protein
VSFIVRVAEPAEYAEAGQVTAGAYRADDLLRRTDGVIDTVYEAELADAGRRAREAGPRWISGDSSSTCETRRPLLRRGAQPGSGI